MLMTSAVSHRRFGPRVIIASLSISVLVEFEEAPFRPEGRCGTPTPDSPPPTHDFHHGLAETQAGVAGTNHVAQT